MEKKIKEYLEWKATYATRASINYRKCLYLFVEVCGDKELSKYTVNDTVKFKVWLDGKYAPSYVQFMTIVLKNFFKFFKEQDYKCLAPSLIKVPRAKAKSHRAITREEHERILSVIPTNEFLPLRDSIMLRILWDTGVRVSELCDLDVSQISEKKRSTVISTKKNENMRIIVWSKETHEYLMKYMPIRIELENLHPGTKALFVGQKGGHPGGGWTARITPRTVERKVKYYSAVAGIKEKITPHSYRHGWGHERRDKNAPLAFIQRGLGHVDPSSTFIYEQYNDNEFVRNAKSYL
ncbi:tyrosine-type recombinase/integrase [bacterium AH-315-M05]|nr:tyrosine-type recombinase/integrase [bacterium AH-315-M05]